LSFHLISIALLLAVALVLAFRIGLPRDSRIPSPAIISSAQAERIVVLPTAGGQLEVATVRVRETFTRSDSRLLFDRIDLGTTVSEIRVDAVYRFHIGMEKAWPLRIVGKTCLVQAGAVEPALPVAFDSRTIERRTSSGWARFNKAENLEALERSLSRQLAERAPLYREQAEEAGRQVVAEFVTEWLLRQQQWRRDPDHRVVVHYGPQIASGRPPAAVVWTHSSGSS
jgi:hypothetical protein